MIFGAQPVIVLGLHRFNRLFTLKSEMSRSAVDVQFVQLYTYGLYKELDLGLNMMYQQKAVAMHGQIQTRSRPFLVKWHFLT